MGEQSEKDRRIAARELKDKIPHTYAGGFFLDLDPDKPGPKNLLICIDLPLPGNEQQNNAGD
jgi:hypothetical protein